MNNLTDMDNLSTNRAARKLVELALISFLGACHNGTDVGLLRIHFLSAWIIFLPDIGVAQHNTELGRSLGHLIVHLSPVILQGNMWLHVGIIPDYSHVCPEVQIIPDLRTHQRWLCSPFADLHTLLLPVRSPESDGEIGLISRVNLYMRINRTISGLHVLFWFEHSLSKK